MASTADKPTDDAQALFCSSLLVYLFIIELINSACVTAARHFFKFGAHCIYLPVMTTVFRLLHL